MPYPSPIFKEKKTLVCYKNITYVKFRRAYTCIHTPQKSCVFITKGYKHYKIVRCILLKKKKKNI